MQFIYQIISDKAIHLSSIICHWLYTGASKKGQLVCFYYTAVASQMNINFALGLEALYVFPSEENLLGFGLP
jgi:hypothetical protein